MCDLTFKKNYIRRYPCYWGGYENLSEIQNELSVFQNLICIGRNGQHRYNNMDHSMETAMKAVRVVAEDGDRVQVWSVNTSTEYNES